MSFDERVFDAIRSMKAFGYTPQYLLNMIGKYGVLSAVKKLVISPTISQGLNRLEKENALKLSLESIVLESEWDDLFNEKEKEMAKMKLKVLETL